MLEDGDSLAATVLGKFLGPEPKMSVSRVSQGLSGGAVYRCSTPERSFALKRWPAGTMEQRVDEVHCVQIYAHQTLPLVPRLCFLRENCSRVTLGSQHFELSTWLPGTAFAKETGDKSPRIPVAAAVNSGAAAIARFHVATQGLGTALAPAPAIFQRLKRLGEIRQELPDLLANSGKMTGPARLAAEYLIRNWQRLQFASESLLRPYALKQVPIQWVLRDSHREHILFENGGVSGIVDFDAIRKDTVGSDLARWVGSFTDLGVKTELLWGEAFAGYSSVREISPCEQQLSGAIEEASWYIHLANWLTWMTDPSRTIPGGIEAAQARVTSLLRRSDVWVMH